MPYCDFIIDKITNSLEDRISGKIFPTLVQPATEKDLRSVNKKDGWQFSWIVERRIPNRQIYKLTITGIKHIQGLLSLEVHSSERYIELHLIEAAPQNFGRDKRYYGVPANLVAFACKMSFESGFDGMVCFTAKTRLINHYKKTLGAINIFGNNRMVILNPQAKKLVALYFKNFSP